MTHENGPQSFGTFEKRPPDFHSFLSSGNSTHMGRYVVYGFERYVLGTIYVPIHDVPTRTCTDLHRFWVVWLCNMDDGEFEFVYHSNNHLNPFGSFLSLLVVK